MPAKTRKRPIQKKKKEDNVNLSHLALGLVAVFAVTIGTILVFTRKSLKDRTYLFSPDVLYEVIIHLGLALVLLPCMYFLPSSFEVIRYTILFFLVFVGASQLTLLYNMYRQTSSKKQPNPYFVNLVITLAVCAAFAVAALWVIHRYGSTDFVRSYILYCTAGKECTAIRPLWTISIYMSIIVTWSLLIQFLTIHHHTS